MHSIKHMYQSAVRKSCFVALVLQRTLSTNPSTTSTAGTAKQLSLITKVICKPDLEKVKGEDAYFTLPHSAGVFDGVGGWRNEGIDVSLFSETLADSARDYIKNAYSPNDEAHIDLRMALTYGMEIIREKDITGSSTACMFSINSKKREANILNLGDSSILIFRPNPNMDNVVHFGMPFQTYGFNCPAQIGYMSKKLRKGNSNPEWNSPLDADCETIDIEPNDLVLLATDGLFDNMPMQEIAYRVCKYFDYNVVGKMCTKSSHEIEGVLFRAVADLVDTTLQYSLDTEKVSPFSEGYNENLRKKFIEKYDDYLKKQPDRDALIEEFMSKRQYKGGKPDDITISLSMVKEV